MIELGGKPGELAITLEIKRAATGETETVELIGTIIDEDADDGSNTQHSGA